MKITIWLLTLLLSVAGAQAQGLGPSQQFSRWKLYTANGEEFAVSLPSYPSMQTTKEKLREPLKDRRRRVLTTTVSEVVYTVHSVDNPNRQLSLDAFIQEQTSSAPAWDLTSARNVDVDGSAGKAFIASDQKGVVQFFATEDRLYEFRAYGMLPDDPRMKWFFSSVSLKKNADSIEVFDGPGSFFEPVVDDIYKGSDVDRKVVIKSKPEPPYTGIARASGITGTVVLRCIFTSKGTVNYIYVIRGVPGGLTERAMEAARRIKFTPATKDGKPVSMWMELQYNFHF